jgi:hypothetical protein
MEVRFSSHVCAVASFCREKKYTECLWDILKGRVEP